MNDKLTDILFKVKSDFNSVKLNDNFLTVHDRVMFPCGPVTINIDDPLFMVQIMEKGCDMFVGFDHSTSLENYSKYLEEECPDKVFKLKKIVSLLKGEEKIEEEVENDITQEEVDHIVRELRSPFISVTVLPNNIIQVEDMDLFASNPGKCSARIPIWHECIISYLYSKNKYNGLRCRINLYHRNVYSAQDAKIDKVMELMVLFSTIRRTILSGKNTKSARFVSIIV